MNVTEITDNGDERSNIRSMTTSGIKFIGSGQIILEI